MQFMNWLSKKSMLSLLIFCSLPFILSAMFNHGFMASDEYWTGITRYIPAQKSTLQNLVSDDDVKSHVQILPMHLAAQTALKLGIEKPADQFSFVVFLLGLINTFLLFLFFSKFHKNDIDRKMSVLCLALYFGAPSVLTRPMFEALSSSFLTGAALFAFRYDKDENFKDLFWGVLLGTVAFMIRPQTGICTLAFPLIVIFKKNWKHLAWTSLMGVTLLFLTGIPDLILRGHWHHSLWSLISYNAKFGGDYGNEPWWYYFPLIFVLCLGPWFISRYEKQWRKNYLNDFKSVFLMIGLFILQHTFFANKFERFLIPLVPIFILLLVPPLMYFIRDYQNRKWRLLSLALVNGFFWIPATFSVAQGHLIDITLHFEAHPEIESYINVDQAITWLPDVFGQRGALSRKDISLESIQTDHVHCPAYILAKASVIAPILDSNPELKVIKTFSSGMIEQWAYAMNPSHNERRAPLVLIGCKN